MKSFTLLGYEFPTRFSTKGLQDHLDEFVVLARLMGYQITSEQDNADIFFYFRNEKNFFDINLKRMYTSPYKIFCVRFNGSTIKMSQLDDYNFMNQYVDNSKDIIKILNEYKEVM